MAGDDLARDLARIEQAMNDRWEIWRVILSPVFADGTDRYDAPIGWRVTQKLFRGYAAPGYRPHNKETIHD